MPQVPDRTAVPSRLTFAIPTYNGARTLPATLENLAAQIGDRPDVRILVSDNASTDTTAAVLQALQARFPFIDVIRQPSNVGFDRNLCAAVEQATAEHVWLFGDDDLLVPGALDQVLAALGPDVVYVNWLEGAVAAQDAMVVGGDQFLAATGTGSAFMGSLVVRRDAWLRHLRPAFVGTDFVHLYAALQVMAQGTAAVLADRLVIVGLPEPGQPHWTRGKRFLKIYFADICRCLRSFEGTLGYSGKQLGRTIKSHLRPLVPQLAYVRATYGAGREDLLPLRDFMPRWGFRWLVLKAIVWTPRKVLVRVLKWYRTLAGAAKTA